MAVLEAEEVVLNVDIFIANSQQTLIIKNLINFKTIRTIFQSNHAAENSERMEINSDQTWVEESLHSFHRKNIRKKFFYDKIMPRKALVSKEETIALIERFIKQLVPTPSWSSDVWKKMSIAVDGRWSPHNVYVNFIQNRRQVRSIALKNCGIEEQLNISVVNDTTLHESTLKGGDDTLEAEDEAVGLDEFPILITDEEWNEMRDVINYDARPYPSLKNGVWSDTLYVAIRLQTETKCNFAFHGYQIYSREGSRHFLRATGYCTSKKCGNKIFCYLYKQPQENESFYMTVRTRDTAYEPHEPVKRQLRGKRRQLAGEAAFYEGAGNWQKRKVNELTKFAGSVPPEVPNLDILRKAKKEFSDNLYGIKPTDSKDVIANIEAMRYTPKYQNFIQEVRSNKFFVAYSTPAQRHAYKQYRVKTKKYSTISIDGTGSLIRPISRPDGSTSGHIFLYAITVNFHGKTVPVYDFLTEAQDTNTLTWGLQKWLESGALKPQQAICDGSRALMNAISTAFNHQTVKTYNETCFLFASDNEEYYYRPPIYTYLRLDVAHLKNTIRRWDCIKNMRFTKVRQLYLFAVSLMIDSEQLHEFEQIWSLVCIIGLHEYQDTVLQDGQTVLEARKVLERKIAYRNYDEKEAEALQGEEMDHHDAVETQSSDRSRVSTWIDEIYNKALRVRQLGTEPNSFYFNDFIERFKPMASEFCLWTSIPIPFFRGHATSSDVEGHFNDLKKRILKNFSGLLRADKFLKVVFNDHIAGAIMLNSDLTHFIQEHGLCPSPLLKDLDRAATPRQSEAQVNDAESCVQEEFLPEEEPTSPAKESTPLSSKILSTIEACSDKWHKTMCPNVTGFYFEPQPDIEYRNELNNVTKKSHLLSNGNNIRSHTSIQGKYYSAKNTCSFDSIIQILLSAAMDDEHYSLTLTSSKNKTMKFVLDYMQAGSVKRIYDARVSLLISFFPELIHEHLGDHSVLKSYSLDIYGNVTGTWTRCFSTEPSAYLTFTCPQCGKYMKRKHSLSVNHCTVGDKGFQALAHCEHFNEPGKYHCINDSCDEICKVTIDYQPQVFVELDIRPNLTHKTGLECKLCDLPAVIDLKSHKYRLVGVIEHKYHHYKAYCYRGMANWEVHDDCSAKISRCDKNKEIEPHAAIYVRFTPRKLKMLVPKISEPNEKPRMRTPEKNNVKRIGTDTVILMGDHEDLNDSDTMSRDNWRGKEKKDVVIDHSVSFDNSSADNTLAADEETLYLLQKGESQCGIVIDNTIVHVAKCSAFDAIVNLLWCTAQNNPDYAALISNSEGNDTFELINSLLSNQCHAIIYRRRAQILLSLCHTEVCYSTEKLCEDIQIVEVEVCGTPAAVWENCLSNEPSQWKTYNCICGSYIQPISVLEPDMAKISIKSNKLCLPLEFHEVLKKVQCRRPPCSSRCDVQITPNFHLFIHIKRPTKCTLGGVLKIIEMGDYYQLAGVIGAYDERYLSFCLVKGKWWLYDNQHSNVQMTSQSEFVELVGVVYILKSAMTC